MRYRLQIALPAVLFRMLVVCIQYSERGRPGLFIELLICFTNEIRIMLMGLIIQMTGELQPTLNQLRNAIFLLLLLTYIYLFTAVE